MNLLEHILTLVVLKHLVPLPKQILSKHLFGVVVHLVVVKMVALVDLL